MDAQDFNELLSQAQQVGKLIAAIFEGAADEDLNLESAVRRYPVVSLSLAAGAGMLGGWWMARRIRSTGQLPPPAPPKQVSRLETLVDHARDLTSELKSRSEAVREHNPDDPLAYLDIVVPGGAERVRHVLPEGTADEVAEAARSWLDSVLEPKLREGVDTIRTNAVEGRFGLFVRQTIERLEEQYTEEHRLLEDQDGEDGEQRP